MAASLIKKSNTDLKGFEIARIQKVPMVHNNITLKDMTTLRQNRIARVKKVRDIRLRNSTVRVSRLLEKLEETVK